MPFDPNSLLDVSHLAAFLGGTAVGAAGTYMADRQTDKRRDKEQQSIERQKFKRLSAIMADWFLELRTDLNTPGHQTTREFVILQSEGMNFNHDRPRFSYHLTKHPALLNQVAMLVEAGYAEANWSGPMPIYRLREPFVAKLLAER